MYAEHEAQKAALIQTLVTHKCPMPKAHLQQETLQDLRQYHTMMHLDTPAPSYLGQGLSMPPPDRRPRISWHSGNPSPFSPERRPSRCPISKSF